MTVSLGSFCVASTSSIAALTETAIAKEFNVSHELTILTISLFVCGLAIGPLVVGPFSEMYGRNWIYGSSFALFFVFSWPVAFAPNIGQSSSLFCVCQLC
jgi:MFS family permease